MATLYVQSPTLYLAGSGIVIGATSATLTNLVDIYGNVLTMTDFGDLGYITFEPDTSNAEGATFTGITANANGTYTLTGLKTILAKSPYTQTSGAVRNHAGGTKVVVTDNVGFWDTFINKNNDSTVVGKVTFPNGAKRPVLDADTDTATATAVVTYGQLSRTVIAGGVAATTTTLGYVKISAEPVSALSPIAVGDNDGRVPTQAENDALVGNNTSIAVGSGNTFVTQTGLQVNAEKYAADAGASDTYAITLSPALASYATGMMVIMRANTANTGTATLNVNGLGAKTIVKGVSTTLSDGDIGGSMVCVLVYNGTNFVLTNPTVNALGNMLNLVTTDVTYSSSTAENTLLSYSLPGNVLGTGNAVRVTMHVSNLGVTSTNTWTLRFKYGATTIATKVYTNVSGNNVFQGKIEFLLASTGTSNSQNGSYSLNLGTPNYIGNGNLQGMMFSESAQGTSAIDSSTAQTIAVTSQHSYSSVNDNITVSMIVVEKITA